MKFNEHQIPKILYRFSFLIGIIHFWNRWILLRNWHVLSEIKNQVKQNNFHSFLDAGCGDGQHYFWLQKNYPNKTIYAVDKIQDNVKFCNHHLSNNNCYQGNVENFKLHTQVDAILLIGLLQYVEKDEESLINLKNTLTEQGKIIFYSPINNRKILSFYQTLFNKYNNYEKTQSRQRLYQEAELIKLIEKVGLSVSKKKYTIGTLGILSQEIYASLLILFEKVKVKPLVLFLIYFFGPSLVMLNFIDFITSKKTGNGLLLVLEKTKN